jgi:hypothetical protein
MIITETSLRSEVARWAVRQSPYETGPEGLADVLVEVSRRFRSCPGVEAVLGSYMLTLHADRGVLRQLLQTVLLDQPQVQRWNQRRNGREGMGIISRYDPPSDPDDDFIDLDALARNVASALIEENDRYVTGRRATRFEVQLWQRRAAQLWELLEQLAAQPGVSDECQKRHAIWNRSKHP